MKDEIMLSSLNKSIFHNSNNLLEQHARNPNEEHSILSATAI